MSAPTRLTGEPGKIKEFLDKFDVRTRTEPPPAGHGLTA